MADRYVALPNWRLCECGAHDTPEAAAAAASEKVLRDGVPRLVVRVVAEVRVPARTPVEIVRLAEVG